MQRPDLHPCFEGWQVVDATPQEESPHGGGYCTGPTSLKAVKEGHSVSYDTDFVIAEVCEQGVLACGEILFPSSFIVFSPPLPPFSPPLPPLLAIPPFLPSKNVPEACPYLEAVW